VTEVTTYNSGRLCGGTDYCSGTLFGKVRKYVITNMYRVAIALWYKSRQGPKPCETVNVFSCLWGESPRETRKWQETTRSIQWLFACSPHGWINLKSAIVSLHKPGTNFSETCYTNVPSGSKQSQKLSWQVLTSGAIATFWNKVTNYLLIIHSTARSGHTTHFLFFY